VHPDLINPLFAYASVSRAAHDVQVFTDDAASLTASLSHDVTKATRLKCCLKLGYDRFT